MPALTAKKLSPFHLFTGRDLPWLVDTQAEARPDKTYLVWESFVTPAESWTYSQFAEETRAYAEGFARQGVQQGDFVLIHLDNCPEFLFAWHACSRLGAIGVTTNTHSSAEELDYFVKHCGAKVAITQPKYIGLVSGLSHSFSWVATIDHDAGVVAPSDPPSGIIRFSSLRGNPAAAPTRTRDPMAPNNVQYTSGTTSRPKGVVWTHANALWTARTTATHLRLTEDDATLVYFPLFHSNALALSMLSTLWSGATAVLTPRFSASRFWDLATKYKCTWASMVMFTLRAVMAQPDPPSHNYRVWASAGDLSFIKQRYGIKTTGWFGMTETLTAAIAGDQKLIGPEGSMGMVGPEYEVSIRDENDHDVAFGETGRLFIRGIPGLSLFYEYLNNPEATNAAFDADGWFDTGDEVACHANGEIFFVGRAKDMLKVGGENVAAIEIETVIARVQGVAECAVVGKPDDMLDEIPIAFVVAPSRRDSLEAEIHAACEAALSHFKRPKQIVFLDELPTGLLGKTLKTELRSRLRTDSPAS